MVYLMIMLGGGVGALLRYASSQWINSIFKTQFSFGTIFVNCIGAFLIGFLINFFDVYSLNPKWKLMVITGFLGGYTTFSAYSLETVQYFIHGNIKYGIMNIAFNNVLCIILALLGLWFHNAVFSK